MLLGFILARKRRLDLATVRAVAERRPPERSGVNERRAAIRWKSLMLLTVSERQEEKIREATICVDAGLFPCHNQLEKGKGYWVD
jgi:hypothetical protein